MAGEGLFKVGTSLPWKWVPLGVGDADLDAVDTVSFDAASVADS
jgi:hypothetical protein